MVIVAAMIVFFMGMSPSFDALRFNANLGWAVFTFAVHPYYWPVLEMGNSPPLGTRAGWISMGILPFMLSVYNILKRFKTCSHSRKGILDKIQFDRYTHWDPARETPSFPSLDCLDHVYVVNPLTLPNAAWIDGWTDITSLAHTFPFVVHNIRNGTMELNYRTKSYYWTGVAALVPQVRCRLLRLRVFS
jgi:hypothetical protein